MKQFEKKLEKALEHALNYTRKKSNMQPFAKRARDLIYRRTKSGYGVGNGGERRRLKPLSPLYIEKRKNMPLGDLGSNRRSNLTLTGQMLNAMGYKVTNNGFEVAIRNSARRDSKHTNAEIAKFVESKGRPFMDLTKGELRIILKELEKELRAELTAIFK